MLVVDQFHFGKPGPVCTIALGSYTSALNCRYTGLEDEPTTAFQRVFGSLLAFPFDTASSRLAVSSAASGSATVACVCTGLPGAGGGASVTVTASCSASSKKPRPW